MSESQKSTPSSFQNQALDGKLREGMYVNAGQTLFWINDFKEVWGIISVEPSLNTYLQQGQKIEISSELLDKHISTELKLIEPEFRSGQKFTQARVYIPNPSGMLKPNSLFTATIRLKSKIIRVPESSVYSLGKRKIVWVKAGENDAKKTLFRATIVETGPASGEFIQIMSGLKGNEEIALHAGYLLDSESLIKKDL